MPIPTKYLLSPFEVLLTPFWSLIKHLLKLTFVTDWFRGGYKLGSYICFLALFRDFYLTLCNNFSESE